MSSTYHQSFARLATRILVVMGPAIYMHLGIQIAHLKALFCLQGYLGAYWIFQYLGAYSFSANVFGPKFKGYQENTKTRSQPTILPALFTGAPYHLSDAFDLTCRLECVYRLLAMHHGCRNYVLLSVLSGVTLERCGFSGNLSVLRLSNLCRLVRKSGQS